MDHGGDWAMDAQEGNSFSWAIKSEHLVKAAASATAATADTAGILMTVGQPSSGSSATFQAGAYSLGTFK